ncbi:hypothetical protein BV25DRAFT_450905 [Artomyces pyxidatus]|uniref:Uncharacterized protein n=1 Tax=Artomyces pyxidatus TaxID=48021 RepID=A0ACB8T4H8_9AGAM|nr:hypothetical protein BV25DRAFT_450905 [Artomyces pyxidatus]
MEMGASGGRRRKCCRERRQSKAAAAPQLPPLTYSGLPFPQAAPGLPPGPTVSHSPAVSSDTARRSAPHWPRADGASLLMYGLLYFTRTVEGQLCFLERHWQRLGSICREGCSGTEPWSLVRRTEASHGAWSAVSAETTQALHFGPTLARNNG